MDQHVYEEMARIEDTNWFFVGRREIARELLKRMKIPKNSTILDVGSGTGGMMSMLRQFGSVSGIEVYKPAAAVARKRGLTVRSGSANSLPFPDMSMDVITIFDVLYHKGIDEKKVMRETFRVLKPGGMLIVTDCAHPWAWTKHDVTVHSRKRFTKRELLRAISDAGFTPKRSSFLFASTFPVFILRFIINSLTGSAVPLSRTPPVVNTLLSLFLTLESKLIPRLNMPFGSTIYVHAIKP